MGKGYFSGIFLIIGIFLTLFSCSLYSEEVFLDRQTIKSEARWNAAHTRIAFMSYSLAWRNEKFFDGSLKIFRQIAVFVYTPGNDSLKKIFDFGEIPRYGNYWSRLTFSDDHLFFKLESTGGWEWLVQKDSNLIDMKNKLDSYYVYDLNRNTIEKTDSVTFWSVHEQNGEDTRISLSKLNDMLNKVSLTKFGLVLSEFKPEDKKYYINELVRMDGNSLYRRAVIEQVISKMNSEEIKNILDRIESYKKELDNYERLRYEYNSKDTQERLINLLNRKG